MKDKPVFTAVVIAILIIVSVSIPFAILGPNTRQNSPDLSLSKENLWKEICKYPFQDCVLVWKSAVWECGHDLDSRNAVSRRNLFGMGCNNRVPKCSKDKRYAIYDSWQHSVEDRYVHEVLYYKGGSYKSYINRHWGIMDGTYVDTINQIKFNPYGTK